MWTKKRIEDLRYYSLKCCNDPGVTMLSMKADEVQALADSCLKMIEALEFYSSKQHLQLDQMEVSKIGVIFDYDRPEWKIGPPFVVGAEYGQCARKALEWLQETNDKLDLDREMIKAITS